MDWDYLLKVLVPTNARTLMGSLAGDKSPITEKNFTPEELDYITKQVNTKNKSNEFKIQNVRNRESYERFPNSKNGVTVPYDTYAAEKQKEITPYLKTRDKTSIGYSDYPTSVNQDWIDSLTKSYTDPAYNVQTTLGRYNAVDKGDHFELNDIYDFNGDFKHNDNTKMGLLDMFKDPDILNSPTMLLSGLSELFGATPRPVNLRIPKE